MIETESLLMEVVEQLSSINPCCTRRLLHGQRKKKWYQHKVHILLTRGNIPCADFFFFWLHFKVDNIGVHTWLPV